MTEQEINNLIDSKIGKVKMSQLPEATQTSGLYSIGYTGNQSVKYKANLLQGDPLTVRKTYQTEAEALADKNPIDTTTSLPLKVGQFVSIVDDGEKNGIYRIGSIDGDGTMSLELQGKLGDLSDYAKKGGTTKTLKEVDDEKADHGYASIEVAKTLKEVEDNASVKIENLVENGDFRNGTTGWSKNTGASLSVVDGVATFLPSQDGLQYLLKSMDIKKGSIYYLSASINADTQVGFTFGNGASNASDRTDIQSSNNTPGVMSRSSRIISLGDTTNADCLLSRATTAYSFKNAMCVNLTETFGAGNEPSIEEMDLLISTLGIDYFEGEITVSAQKIMQWQLANTAQTNLTIDQLAGEVSKRSKYPYEDGYLFSQTVLDAGIDKWLIDAYFDFEHKEGMRYSFSIIQKNSLTANLYSHIEGQPALGNIVNIGEYNFTKIDGSKYYKGVLAGRPNDWVIADFDAMTVESQSNIYYTSGIGLSPRLFRNGIIKSKVEQSLGDSTINTISQKVITEELSNRPQVDPNTLKLANVVIDDVSYMHPAGMDLYTLDTSINYYSQPGLGVYMPPQGKKLLVRRIKFNMTDITESKASVRVLKSTVKNINPDDNTLVEGFSYTDVRVDENGLNEIILSENLILEDNEYLYVYADRTQPPSLRVPLISEQHELGGLVRLLFKMSEVWYTGGTSYLTVPLMLFSSISDSGFDPTEIDDINDRIDSNEQRVEALEQTVSPEIVVSLPDKINAVVGDTLQIFLRGVVQAPNPYVYDILVSCGKGRATPRYFTYKPVVSDIGTIPFKVEVKTADGVVIGSKTCELEIVAAPTQPSTQINIACFGDSLTSAGIWCREADRRLTEAGGTPVGNNLSNIDFVGAKTNGTTGYHGVGGWVWSSYTTSGRPAYRFQVSGINTLEVGATYSNNASNFTILEVNVTDGVGNVLGSATAAPTESGTLTKVSGGGDETITFSSRTVDSQNPLWDYDNSKMTFIPYADRYADGQIDVVYVLLGWNGKSAWTSDYSGELAQVKIFADKLHEEFPNAKLKILGIQLPAQDGGLGMNYGASGVGYTDRYGLNVSVFNFNKSYQEFANQPEYSPFVEFINVSSQFDSEYNMPKRQASPVNIRNSVDTELMSINGVHPDTSGYMQIADVVYRNFVANFCQ